MTKKYTPPPSSPLTQYIIPKPRIESPISKKIHVVQPSKLLPACKVSDRRTISNKVYQNLQKIYDQQELLDLAEAAVKEEELKEIELERTLSGLDSMNNTLEKLEQGLSVLESLELALQSLSNDSSELEALALALQSLGEDSLEQTIPGQDAINNSVITE